MNYYFGVDVGRKSAIAVVNQFGLVGTHKFNGGDFVEVCVALRWLESVASGGKIVRGVIEKPFCAMGQGVSSVQKLAMTYGFLCGNILSAGLPLQCVTPSVWTVKTMFNGLSKSARVAEIKTRLGVKERLTQDEADACGIALYARDHVNMNKNNLSWYKA